MGLSKLFCHNRMTHALRQRCRKKRFHLFEELVQSLPRPLKILDVGGTQEFWEKMSFSRDDVQVVLLNIFDQEVSAENFTAVKGNATDLSEFQDGEFDLVFSNSVIEHLFDYQGQEAMASEVRRVANHYYIQTPNKYFPIEPHFYVPFFQFFPLRLKVFLVRRFSLGAYHKRPDRGEAEILAKEVRLLTADEMKSLFPKSTLHKERFAGLTKSFAVMS